MFGSIQNVLKQLWLHAYWFCNDHCREKIWETSVILLECVVYTLSCFYYTRCSHLHALWLLNMCDTWVNRLKFVNFLWNVYSGKRFDHLKLLYYKKKTIHFLKGIYLGDCVPDAHKTRQNMFSPQSRPPAETGRSKSQQVKTSPWRHCHFSCSECIKCSSHRG